MKPRMLIVEDGERMLDQFVNAFKRNFDIEKAQDGAEGKALIESKGPFDVGLFDIIMPAEDPGMSFDETETTGLRLMRLCIDRGVCSRFVVASVSGIAQERVASILSAKARWVRIRKSDLSLKRLVESVDEVMKG